MTPDCRRILNDFARHRTIFNFTVDGLGRDLCKIGTDGVQATLAAQQAPDGTRWDELSADYAEWKDRHFPGQPMALLHHLMADPAQVSGTPPDVTPDRADVAYGVSEEARQEARWFSDGDPGANRPPRPFWGFTREAIDRVNETLKARFEAMV